MKKLLKIIFIILLTFFACNSQVVSARETANKIPLTILRAGGGSSSSGGGGTSHSSSSRSHNSNGNRGNVISNLIVYTIFIITLFSASIILYIKVVRASFNSKRYLRLIDNKDITWRYKTIEKQVIEAFYNIEEAWTNNDIDKSKSYMTNDLYESFKIKLNWMDINNRRNILKKIRLVNLKPVSVYDDVDDNKDLIWFYIKGKMIDYIIDTKTNEIIDGNTKNKAFIEFWKFVRDDDKWVLSEILQKDETYKIGL